MQRLRTPTKVPRIRAALLALATMAGTAGVVAAAPVAAQAAGPPRGNAPSIVNDPAASTVTMADGQFRMVYDYGQESAVTSFTMGQTQMLNAGMYSSVQLDSDGSAIDSRHLTASPTVNVRGNVVTSSFTMGNASLSLHETWTFTVTPRNIQLKVARSYDWLNAADPNIRHNGQLTIGWARVWDNIRRPEDGGDLPIGNAYTGASNFFLSAKDDRYGVEESRFVMLKNATRQALDVSATSNRHLATEFAYTGDANTYQETQVSSAPSWQYTAGTKANGLVYGGHSSNGTTSYIYAPVATTQNQTDTVAYRFGADDYGRYYSLGGKINGVADPAALSSLLNDFGRSGVIDKGYGMSTVGLRYPGVGPYDMVYADRTVLGYYDPAMTQSQLNLLTYFRDYAQESDGHMQGRTFHLDHPWSTNSLYDADPSYAMAVADMYQYSANRTWLTSMRSSVERSLAYMISNQYSQTDGLFHNDLTSCTSTKGAREWNDGLYVRYESGYVNELMYGALTEWAALESGVFHDSQLARSYSSLAAALKAQFNKDDTAGGLWDPGTGMFAYWRCPDGTVQGKVEQTQVNLQAIYYGMVSLGRARQILDGIDQAMVDNRLSLIPLNFLPYTNNVETGSYNGFQTGLENGAIYPLMTEEYMRAAALVGERQRSLTYLNNTVARYTQDGFNNFSYLTWFLKSRYGCCEAWFPSNANGAAGLYSDVLGIQPTATGVTIAPNIPASMNGSTVTRAVGTSGTVTVAYHDELSETVDYRTSPGPAARGPGHPGGPGGPGGRPVTLQWSGQTPSAGYTVIDNGRPHRVTADSFGIVRYTYTGRGQHTVTLAGGNAQGYVLPTRPAPTDLALNKSVTTSSSLEDGNFGAATAVDGDHYSVAASEGWSSNSDLTANHTEWISVDLGKPETVGNLTLWPRNFNGTDLGDDFPIDFSIQTSTDGTTWHTVVSKTGYPKPTDGSAQSFGFTPQTARYVRVEGTNLRNDEGGQYRIELSELEVYSGSDAS